MQFEDVLGLHLIISGILMVIYLHTGEPNWIQYVAFYTGIIVYGIYVPVYIIYKLWKYLVSKIKIKKGVRKGENNVENWR